RLRWLFVIARGSSFRFRSADPDVCEIGHALNVRYCLTGLVEMQGAKVTVAVELADTRDGSVVWGDRFVTPLDGLHALRAEIVNTIVTALEIQIPANEARAARLTSPENLDAWSAFHLGLQHVHRFN